jgi:hypothetical protein
MRTVLHRIRDTRPALGGAPRCGPHRPYRLLVPARTANSQHTRRYRLLCPPSRGAATARDCCRP